MAVEQELQWLKRHMPRTMKAVQHLLADGAMLNLAAGFGDSINAFDVTLAMGTRCLDFIFSQATVYPPGLHTVPPPVWQASLSSAPAGCQKEVSSRGELRPLRRVGRLAHAG